MELRTSRLMIITQNGQQLPHYVKPGVISRDAYTTGEQVKDKLKR
jgi:hypothetical protein